MPVKNVAFVATVPIYTSAGVDTVVGITTASMTPVLYTEGKSANPAGSMFSVGAGIYGLSIAASENSGDSMLLRVIVSATAANGFVVWMNEVIGSASFSAMADVVLDNYGVASAGELITIAQTSTAVSAALTNYNVASVGDITQVGLTSAATSAIVQTVMVLNKLDHLVAVAESDDPVNDSILAKIAARGGDWSTFNEATDSLENAAILQAAIIVDTAEIGTAGAGLTALASQAWAFIGTEPTGAPAWTSANKGQLLDWMAARNVNRMHQASASATIYSSAGVAFASSKMTLTSKSASTSQWTT